MPSVSNSHKTNEVAVSVRGLGLTYTTAIDRRPTLKARVKSLGRGGKQTRVIRALDEVNLDVEYGQVLGIIGTNGAGKSSLMRVIAGILPPSQGRIEVYGSVSTLLALGQFRKAFVLFMPVTLLPVVFSQVLLAKLSHQRLLDDKIRLFKRVFLCHPRVKQHQYNAGLLTDFIRKKVGW